MKKIKGFDIEIKLPNVVGTIDGSHVPIMAPKINRNTNLTENISKMFFSSRNSWCPRLLLTVATGFPGSLHDARMLRLTDVYWAAEDENILMEPMHIWHGRNCSAPSYRGRHCLSYQTLAYPTI